MKIIHALSLFVAVAVVFPACSTSAEPALKVGDPAPLVKGVDQDGKKWTLASEIGKSPILLYFYPKDNTPGCTAEACGLRDRIGDLRMQGVDVVGVSFDSVDSHKKFVFQYTLNFPLISDPKGEIATLYGTRMGSGKQMDRRISFLIDLNGRIAHITDSPKADVQLTEMEAAVKNLKAHTPL